MATENTPSFAQDIKPMFRVIDRRSMTFAFDLWDYNDVRTHAEEILDRMTEGTMPCDKETAQFTRWMEGGMPA
jgi:hypothetical protein